MTLVRLGLRENLAQFSLLVVVNIFVGAMVGMERSILPVMAEQEFHLAARTGVLSFIVVFGATKALTNYFAGRLSDRFGRKQALVAGWLVAAPVPFLLMKESLRSTTAGTPSRILVRFSMSVRISRNSWQSAAD
jgi:MFS family permease